MADYSSLNGLLSPMESSEGLLFGVNPYPQMQGTDLPPAAPAPNSSPLTRGQKYDLFSWVQKNHPEMMTYNNNEPEVFLQNLFNRADTSDKSPQEQPWTRREVNPFTQPNEFQNLPGQNIYGQRREMPRPEQFKSPNMEKGNDYRSLIQELQNSIQEKERRLGMPFSGTYY